MGLDIRLPLGLIFLIIGAIMALYGAFTWGGPMYASSMGINLNVIWGAVMLVFGGLMFALSRKKV
jgi:hydrogenase-4 membrane subunit HyfE